MTTADIRKADILAAFADELRVSALHLAIAERCAVADGMLAEMQELTPMARSERWKSLDSAARQQLAWAAIRKVDALGWNTAPDVDRILIWVQTLDEKFSVTPSNVVYHKPADLGQRIAIARAALRAA